MINNLPKNIIASELVYIENHPDNIMCYGGIGVEKIEVKQVNMPPIPEQKQPSGYDKDTLRVCKEAFDNGGLICAFAPKLKIRDCYEKNLKDFHECLKEEEK